MKNFVKQFRVERRSVFNQFAWYCIGRSKDHYYKGKASWYFNDDEQEFIEAVKALNDTGPIMGELSEGDRKVITEWHSKLKSELNPNEFEKAGQEWKIVNGPGAQE